MERGRIYIFDIIDAEWGVGAQQVSELIDNYLANNIDKFTVYINSPGGDVFEGIAIYNLLKKYDCEVEVLGLAASIASVIAMAGGVIRMSLGSFFMIHNPSTFVWGDQHDMEREAEVLAQIRESAIDIYTKRSGLSRDDIIAMMDAETWLSPAQAKEKNFCDEIVDPVAQAASRSRFVASQEASRAYCAMMVTTSKSGRNPANKQKEPQTMDFKQLLIRVLNLAEDASDEAIETALTNLVDTSNTPAGGSGGEVAELQNQIQNLTGIVQGLVSTSADDRAQALVDSFKDRIPPASRDHALKMAKNDPEAFQEFVNALPTPLSATLDSQSAGPVDQPVDPRVGLQDYLKQYVHEK